ncbi:MAG: hypothetical protein J6Q53_00330 [Oscillospiraceae bacterium]|nr:hypothetical protein [Oscillospiraceae bacterium]
MLYITAAQAAQKWNVTVRRVQDMCRKDLIDGAVRHGRDWMIPMDAQKPADRRCRNSALKAPLPQLPRRSPAIVMTNLYNRPGCAEEAMDALKNKPESAALSKAQIAYCRGEIDEAKGIVTALLNHPCGHDLQIGCGIILAMCAIYKGDTALWQIARSRISDAVCHNEKDQYLSEFWAAAVDSEIHNTYTFPGWFMRGCFDPIAGDSYPAARYYYLKFLFVMGHQYASGVIGERDNQAAMGLFSAVAEPLISQTRKDGALIAEIYMRLLCATSYHDLGKDDMAILHLDTAIRLALPDRLFLILAEYRKNLDFLLDERLNLVNPAATDHVRRLSKAFMHGWTVLHNAVLGRSVTNELTTREREVAKHAAFGLSNKDIAQRLHISVNTVKQSLRAAMDKTGAVRRIDLSHYL